MSPALPLRIGYGPPGRTERHAGVARGWTCFGLGLALGVVVGVAPTVALDAGRQLGEWYGLLAAAVGAGLVVALLLGRMVTNRGAAIGSALAWSSIIAAGAWLVLINTGDPAAVDVLVLVGAAASIPMLTLAGTDALTLRPTAHPLAAVGPPTAAALAGLGVGATVMFVDPTILWSDVSALGGLLALLGALRRVALPDRLRAAIAAPAPSPRDEVPAGVRAMLSITLGIAAAAVVRLAPYLALQWQAGVRYHLLTLAAVGAAGTAALVGSLWFRAAAGRDGATEFDDAARLTVLAGASLIMVAISQTLPGTVIGTGIGSGLALAGIALVGAAGARGGAGVSSITSAAVLGGAAMAITWSAQPSLVDAVGSQRAAMALLGLPALVAGSLLWLRPVAEPISDVVDDGFVIDLAAPAPRDGATAPSTAPIGPRPLLDARGIEFSYGSVQVLFGVDLHVDEGEVVALLGTNGAGKTTFLRTVAGLSTPSTGSIRLAGGDLTRFSASERVLLGINQIAAGAAVAPDLTVAENLAMFGHTLPSGEARAGAARALEVFPRLAERQGQRAAALSGGERQMLALSKSLVLRPRLLIIDECTLGLAPIAVAALVPVIRQLHQEGSSVLLVEQSVHLALDLADRACCMEKGRIVYESSADELRADPGLLEAVYLEGISAALEHRVGTNGSEL